jgi:hypothetical protein
MPCADGIDPADFASGVVDPGDDPSPIISEVNIADAVAAQDPDGTWWARFEISISNINYDDAIQFDYDTSNGTANGGTHYVSDSGIFTIPAGETGADLEVQVLRPNGATGTKTFTVTLSSPSNATLGDAVAIGSIHYGTQPPPDPGDPVDQISYTAFPRQACNSSSNSCTIYDQFSDCKYKAACTGYAGAAAMSALYYRQTGQWQRFDAKKLFADSGGTVCNSCSGCPGFNPTKVLRHMVNTGVKKIDSSAMIKLRATDGFAQITGTTTAQLVQRIKQALVDHGVVYFMSKFYSSPNNGWNRCKDCNNMILRNPVATGPHGSSTDNCGWATAALNDSGVGHTWIITGWNDNKASGGAFEIQSSHGTDWGSGGRCWIPYSYLKQTSAWGYWRLRYGG